VKPPRSTALCYHAVSATWNDPLAVTPEAFEHQIRSLLRRGFTPVGANQLLRGKAATFHVTFDDCFTSISGALDLLLKLGVPATLFVCSSLADTGAPLAVREVTGRAVGHEDELVTLSWSELRELADLGFAIGSHTATHPHLVQLGDSELRDELRLSRQRIEEAVGRPSRFLAYPYGESDARVRAAARHAGYEAAFGLGEGRNPVDLFAFPRADVYRGTDAIRFRAKTVRNGGTARLLQAARRMRVRTG
jgi:peptidoglycan/xylan/chitin deacetylase (PgdA/CDA1 family)